MVILVFWSGDVEGVIEMLYKLFKYNGFIVLLFCVVIMIVEGLDMVFFILIIVLELIGKFFEGYWFEVNKLNFFLERLVIFMIM